MTGNWKYIIESVWNRRNNLNALLLGVCDINTDVFFSFLLYDHKLQGWTWTHFLDKDKRVKITPWCRCCGGWPGWRSARSRGRGWTGPAASPWTRCALRPQLPPPPPPPARRRLLSRPGNLSPPQSDPRRSCAGRRDPPPGSSSPCAAGGAPGAPCSFWARRGRSVARFGPLCTPAGSPPGWKGCRFCRSSRRLGCSLEVCGWTDSRPCGRRAERERGKDEAPVWNLFL